MNLGFSEGNTVPQRERQFDKKQFKDSSGLRKKEKEMTEHRESECHGYSKGPNDLNALCM